MLEIFFFMINDLMLIKNINKETTAMIIGPLLGFIVGAYSIVNGFDIPAGITLWITVWTAIWWVFEAGLDEPGKTDHGLRADSPMQVRMPLACLRCGCFRCIAR